MSLVDCTEFSQFDGAEAEVTRVAWLQSRFFVAAYNDSASQQFSVLVFRMMGQKVDFISKTDYANTKEILWV